MQIVIAIDLKPGVKYLLDVDGAIYLLDKDDSNRLLMNVEATGVTTSEISKDFIAYLLIEHIYNLKDIEKFELISPKTY
jgi:hypothetical protein